jgi:hypothetical protein
MLEQDVTQVTYGATRLTVPQILATVWAHVLRERTELARVAQLTTAMQVATTQGRLADASEVRLTLVYVHDRIDGARRFLANDEQCAAAIHALALLSDYLWAHADLVAQGHPALTDLRSWVIELGNWLRDHRHPGYGHLCSAVRVARARHGGNSHRAPRRRRQLPLVRSRTSHRHSAGQRRGSVAR